MARDQQQAARGDDLLLGELVTGLHHVDQAGHQVVAGIAATLRDQVAKVFVEPQLGLQLAVQVVGSLAGERDERVKRLGRQRRCRAELVLVLHRHAEQAADHRHR